MICGNLNAQCKQFEQFRKPNIVKLNNQIDTRTTKTVAPALLKIVKFPRTFVSVIFWKTDIV